MKALRLLLGAQIAAIVLRLGFLAFGLVTQVAGGVWR